MSTNTGKRSLRERFSIRETPFNLAVAMISEFLGTTFFLFFALAGCQVAFTSLTPAAALTGSSSSSPRPVSTASLLYAALSVGFSLAVNVWVFFRVTSALFNPAITLGMWLIGSLDWKRSVAVVVSQFLGGLAAAGLVSCMFPGELKAETLLGSDTSVVRGFFIELIMTAVFVFSVFMLAADKHRGTFIAPIGIGLALFIAQLVAMPFTGASLNPARSFGAAVATHHFPRYHWIYWIGPLVGSALAAGFYKLVKMLEAETALAMRGDNVLGHRHRISNCSATPAGAQTLPAPLHTLDPVAEQDAEKGLPQAPLEGVGKGNAQQRYVSDPEDATVERGSPKSSSAASLPSMTVTAQK